MTKATMFLLLQLTTVTGIRFTEYSCGEVCAPNSPDIVLAQSSIQCARRCLSSNKCSLFVYNREQQKCVINAEFCCQGWTAYYIGQTTPIFNNSLMVQLSIPANNLSQYHSLTNYGITGTNRNHLLFDLKGCKDGHIGLSKTEMDSKNKKATYEIIVGGSNNTWTYIRQNNDYKAGGPAIIACNSFLPFWVSWENNMIKFGRGHELDKNQVLSWTDPDTMLDIKYIGVGTYGFHIDYNIYL